MTHNILGAHPCLLLYGRHIKQWSKHLSVAVSTTVTPYGASDGLIHKLQSVQKAAACLITGARWCVHISHMLVQLHWLPVWRWLEYKVACLVHQSSCQAMAYLTDTFSDQQLTGLALYHTPTIHTATSFTAAGLRVWNGLLPNLWWDISYGQFKQTLKTFLFGR